MNIRSTAGSGESSKKSSLGSGGTTVEDESEDDRNAGVPAGVKVGIIAIEKTTASQKTVMDEIEIRVGINVKCQNSANDVWKII